MLILVDQTSLQRRLCCGEFKMFMYSILVYTTGTNVTGEFENQSGATEIFTVNK